MMSLIIRRKNFENGNGRKNHRYIGYMPTVNSLLTMANMALQRMPIAFGPMPGPRQTTEGLPRQATESTFKTASIKFKTSRTLLQNLFPPNSSSYRFKSPGTVAYASFSQTTLNKMEWLGGSGYNHLGLYIHGVEYVKKDGEIISGTCELIPAFQI